LKKEVRPGRYEFLVSHWIDRKIITDMKRMMIHREKKYFEPELMQHYINGK
jgi:hypothetical protein